ncbi:MAG: RidA family protein, partial [Imperialibacter sp.]
MKKLLFVGLLGVMTACSSGTSNTKEGADTLKAQVSGPSDYDPEAKLKELGIELSTPSAPVANYVNAVRTGNLIFLAGKGPSKPDGSY